MNKYLFAAILSLAMALTVGAQKRTLVDNNEHIMLKYDPEGETVTIPGMEEFGMFNGYLCGWKEQKGQPYIYGVWALTSMKEIKPGVVQMRFSYDQGSETQAALLEQTSDSTWVLTLKGTTVIKRAVGRKLVKVPSTFNLIQLKQR